LKLDNVVCTPHLGYVERDGYEILFGSAFDQVLAYLAGKPINVLNPEVLEKNEPGRQRARRGLRRKAGTMHAVSGSPLLRRAFARGGPRRSCCTTQNAR